VPDVTDQPAPDQPGTEQPGEPVMPDLALRAAVLELERHAATGGWDQPPRIYALVLTEELLANEPSLESMLGIEPGTDLTGSLTPIEQDELPEDEQLEQLLTEMMWPDSVHGAAVTVERIVLPPSVEVPEDEEAAAELAGSHPEREEVRMVVAATRSGSTYCAMRLRSHDEPTSVLEGPDLVPALLELLQGTLAPVEPGAEIDPADDNPAGRRNEQ
jgi:hypothetical protein